VEHLRNEYLADVQKVSRYARFYAFAGGRPRLGALDLDASFRRTKFINKVPITAKILITRKSTNKLSQLMLTFVVSFTTPLLALL
jgi:hypothetical protein